MSDNSQTIVDLEATPAQATRLAQAVLDRLVKDGVVAAKTSVYTLGKPGHAPGPGAAMTTKRKETVPDRASNWLEVTVGRTVFDTAGNGVELTCASCKKTFEPDDEYLTLVGVWYEGEHDVEFACPKCGKAQRIVEWDGPWAMAMGNRGFTFWNWPELAPAFVATVAEVLGHSVRVVRRHL